MTADVELLPLPEPFVSDLMHGDLYTPEQVRAYARANIATLQAENERLRAEVERLRHHGTLLSNIAYNLAQDDRLSDAVRWSLDDARKKWDAALAQEDRNG